MALCIRLRGKYLTTTEVGYKTKNKQTNKPKKNFSLSRGKEVN
jgi:hypothetical protein